MTAAVLTLPAPRIRSFQSTRAYLSPGEKQDPHVLKHSIASHLIASYSLHQVSALGCRGQTVSVTTN
jgi:site-specific recombinase XerC